MKVVQISTYRYGGAGQAAWLLHQGLQLQGCESKFLTANHAAKNQGNWQSIVDPNAPFFSRVKGRLQRHWQLHHQPLSDGTRRMAWIKKEQQLWPRLNAEIISVPFTEFDLLDHPFVQEADIIHLHWVARLLDYPSFFSRLNKPVVWTLHDTNPVQGIFHYPQEAAANATIAAPFENAITKLKREWVQNSRYPIHFVAPSPWMAEQVPDGWPVSIIPNGLHATGSVVAEKEKANLDWDPWKKTILFVSSEVDNPRKGFDLLYKALMQLNFSYQLVVLGNASGSHYPGVVFTGHIPPAAINEYYRAADVVVIPSRADNLPNVMLEAFAAGTPVVATPVGGMLTHVIPGVTGELAATVDEEAIAKALNNWNATHTAYQPASIMDYARQHFSMEAQAIAMTALYERLLNNH